MRFTFAKTEMIVASASTTLGSRLPGLKLLSILNLAFALLIAVVSHRNVAGQQTAGSAPQASASAQASVARASSGPANPKADSDDNRYRIGPGDVLEVKVLKAPELSLEAVRVDQRGMIRMPMLEDEIMAACLTEAELGHKIADLYREYKRNPNVDVFIKEFQSRPVGVVGAVNNVRPDGSQFRLHRRVKLLELIMLAGGLSEHAGRTVNVVHSGGPALCGDSQASDSDISTMVTYKLIDTMNGVPEANPFLRPGDIVVVPEGEQVYVVGNVVRPSTIPMKEPLTVSQAVARAGGTAPNTKRAKVRIVRQMADHSGKQEIYVDLTAIEKHNAIDVILLPNDIVDVPVDGTRSFLKSLMGAVAPAVSTVPAHVIP